MPHRVNGIGTSYLGKANRRVRQGVCSGCGKASRLETYETRLWFTVLFIPVIPLAKKQVLDQCALCTRHHAVPAGDWARARDEAVSEAEAAAAAQPDESEPTIELLKTYASFHLPEEADRVAHDLAQRFPDRVDALEIAAAWHANRQHIDDARAVFRRILQLDPDHESAKINVALEHIEKGDPDAARQLLTAMEQPDAKKDAGVLFRLAGAYRQQGRFDEAMAIFRTLVDEFPHLTKQREFRKVIEATEAALGRQHESILPPKPRPWGRIFAVMSVVCAIVAGVIFFSSYQKRNQSFYVVNGYANPISVTIDDGVSVSIPPRTKWTHKIAEGPHRAEVAHADGTEETIDFAVENTMWRRLRGKTIFVLNPGGLAPVVWEEYAYSEDPNVDVDDLEYGICAGQELAVIHGVDYPFRPAPAQLRLDSSSRVIKKEVSLWDASPSDVALRIIETDSTETALQYCEACLERLPYDEQTLLLYLMVCSIEGNDQRGENFLERGLARRPVNVDWHLFYQAMQLNDGEYDALVSRYDTLLESEPENASLLYLRANIATTATEAEPYLDRAVEADADFAPTQAKRAQIALWNGEVAEAKRLAENAVALDPLASQVRSIWFNALMVDGDHSLADAMTGPREWNVGIAYDGQETLRALVRAGNTRRTHQWLSEQRDPDDPEGNAWLEYRWQYMEGEPIARWSSVPDSVGQAPLFQFAKAVESGRIVEAEEAYDAIDPVPIEAARYALVLSLAAAEQGDDDRADAWLQTAQREAEKVHPAWAALLESPDSATMASVDDVILGPKTGVPTLLVLADRNDSIREALLRRAALLNLVDTFPYQFLKRRIESR